MAQPDTELPPQATLPTAVRAVIDALPLASLVLSADGTILHANGALERLTAQANGALAGAGLDILTGPHGFALDAGCEKPQEFLAQRADGATFWAALTLAPLVWASPKPAVKARLETRPVSHPRPHPEAADAAPQDEDGDGTTPVFGQSLRIGQIVDITGRREAEAALALSRQREALGLLTNSVAHEFNNFLQILIGYIDGLKRRLGDQKEPFIQRAMSRSTDATERAAILTRQLLAYSRRIAPDVRPIDLDALVADLVGSIGRDLPPGIRLVVETTPDLPQAITNPTQIEFALRHLVANACEAMPDGGTLTLSTYRIEPGDRSMQDPGAGAVGLKVADTGHGMSPEMLARALAPFQTSREAGRGAGLAIVHGLMKRQNGTIALDSEPGGGTRVRLIFPAAPARVLH